MVLLKFNIFPITHIVDTAYNPRSQRQVDGPNSQSNGLIKIEVLEYPQKWDLIIPYPFWNWRTTARSWLGAN